MAKTARLAVNILAQDKAKLERKAAAEGEPMAVLVRRAIRRELASEPARVTSQPEPAQAAQP